jgi:cell division ATPase FtsA
MATGRTYSIGIDVGTTQVKVLVAEYPRVDLGQRTEQPAVQPKHEHIPRIVSTGIAENISYCLVCTTVDDYAKIYKGRKNIGFIIAKNLE